MEFQWTPETRALYEAFKAELVKDLVAVKPAAKVENAETGDYEIPAEQFALAERT